MRLEPSPGGRTQLIPSSNVNNNTEETNILDVMDGWMMCLLWSIVSEFHYFGKGVLLVGRITIISNNNTSFG